VAVFSVIFALETFELQSRAGVACTFCLVSDGLNIPDLLLDTQDAAKDGYRNFNATRGVCGSSR